MHHWLLRPDVLVPVQTGFTPATNGSASFTFCSNPSVFVNQSTTPRHVLGFGNLGRDVIIGPGVSNTDIAMSKGIRLMASRSAWYSSFAGKFSTCSARPTSPSRFRPSAHRLSCVTGHGQYSRPSRVLRHVAPDSAIAQAAVLIWATLSSPHESLFIEPSPQQRGSKKQDAAVKCSRHRPPVAPSLGRNGAEQ